MNSSDSAEELVKIYLDGVEFVLRISGEASKNLVAFLMAMSKDNRQTKGKTRLTNMLKTGKELKIFSIKSEDLKKFSEEAKKYGILYCVLADKKNEKIDGIVDIMVRQEDATKVNRIAERFKFAKVDTATIEKQLEKENQENIKNEQMVDELLAEPIELENTNENSPSNIKSEEKNQLENFLNIKSKSEENNNLYNKDKKSVKKQLEQIKKELNEKLNKENKTENIKNIENIGRNKKQKYKHLKEKQEKNNAKHMKEPKHLDTQKNKKKNKNKIRERSK